MANAVTFAGALAFLRGGGAMADLIAAFDWSSTLLGPLETWPAALKIATSMILNASLPTTLLVGEDAITLYNDAHAKLIDDRHPAALGSKARAFWPEYAPLTAAAIEAAQRGERLSFRELELPHRDGSGNVWLNIDYSPVRDENGVLIGVSSVMVEMTERVLAERKAVLQLDRLRNMFDQAPGFICLMGGPPDFVIEYVNDAHRQLFGDRHAEGRRFVDVFPEEAATGAAGLLVVCERGESYLNRGSSIRLPTADGGWEERFVDSVLQPLKGEDGRITGVFVEGFDVTDRRRAEHRQQLLINELNHRVKNTLATVQSVASQTLRSSPDLAQARHAFEDRLVALAAAHDLLTAQSWRGAPLAEVVASALGPFEAVQRPQVTRGGPSVWLTAARALALSLALHELATNAAKYGALTVPEGRVILNWTVSSGELVLVWTERGGPPVPAPSRSGFGMRLLQRNLARELGGDVALDFAPEGVRCEIRFAIEGHGTATGAKADETLPGPGRFWVPLPDAGILG